MTQRILYSLQQATEMVPFSVDYLRRATNRTKGNPLPAKKAGRKVVILHRDLEAWAEQEEDE